MNFEKEQETEEKYKNFMTNNAGKKDLVLSILRDVLKASESPEFNCNSLEKFDLLMDLMNLIK